MKRFDSRPALARTSNFEQVLGSTMTLSCFLGGDSSSLSESNSVKFESMGLNLRFDVDEINVAVSYASVEIGVTSFSAPRRRHPYEDVFRQPQ